MSTRYVWSKNDYSITKGNTYTYNNSVYTANNPSVVINLYSSSTLAINSSGTNLGIPIAEKTGLYVSDGTVISNQKVYFYFTVGSRRYPTKGVYFAAPRGAIHKWTYSQSTFIGPATATTWQEVTGASKGSPVGTVSNAASSTYPPRDYASKSARMWPYSAPERRTSGGVPE